MREVASFELKSNQYVLTLVCRPSVPFSRLLEDIRDKFRRSAKFFRNGQMAVRFQGRDLTDQEQREIIAAIRESCQLDITCVIEEHDDADGKIAEVIARNMNDTAENTAALVPHSLRNGQRVSYNRTVVILGNVGPGAEVVSSGSIIVLGIAMGILKAGADGDERSFVCGSVLKPLEISIAGHRAVSGIRKTEIDRTYAPDPKVAYLREGHLVLEAMSGDLFEEVLSGTSLQAHSPAPAGDTPAEKRPSGQGAV